MTVTRGLALLLTVATAGALVNASPAPPAGPRAVAAVRLKAISSRVSATGASLVIEASEPVAYVASRPDPLTVLLDFRNVGAEGVANSVAANARSPIAAVSVEPSELLGAPASRVRVSLAQPVAHRVRSSRNTVVIDFDKPALMHPIPVSAPAASRSAAALDPMMALQQRTEPDPLAVLGAKAPAAAPVQARAAAAAPQAPAPGAGLQSTTGPQEQRKYQGNPVSLDFQGADLRAVLRVFADISGLNIVIDPRVTGTVDVALKDVPWDQALDIILRANSLGYIIDGTIVRIAPLDALEAEQKKLTDLAKAQAEAGRMTTLTRQLSYAKGVDIVNMLTKAQILSNRGQAYVDERTNTLIITDLEERLTNATDLINTLDRAQPQVEIEARIVQVTTNYSRALGIQWGFQGRVDPALGNTPPLAFPNNGVLAGTAGPGGTAVNLPAPNATSAVGLALGSINGAFNLDVALSALESSGNGRVLSTPRVTTQNNVLAEVAQGVQVPYQTTSNNTTTTQFKDAALILRVTPQITASGTVIMNISVDNGSVERFISTPTGEIPVVNTQRANTTVLVTDGFTTVIGGIYLKRESSANDRTPGLSRVPLLNWLFKRDTQTDESRELLIFITPRIIRT